MKIGVLGGGVSTEREISLVSARQAHNALVNQGLDAAFIDIISDKAGKVKELIADSGIGLAFVALHGGFGEDGRIQQILEELNIVYTGSGPQASSLAMNKADSKRIFKDAGVPTPAFTLLSGSDEVCENIKYPLVIKPSSSGSSLGVSVVREEKNLSAALGLAFSHSRLIILEEYIEGRELTVGILDEQPLAIVEILPKSRYFDFNAKYQQGASDFVAPAPLDAEVAGIVRDIGLAAHRALGCRHFSRVDIRLDKRGNPFVLEVNSIPGLTSHSLLPLSAKVSGINFNQLIGKMVELALPRYKLRAVTG
jgi:D-alanine-D-alanine ligase